MEWVRPLPVQPHEQDPAVIWADGFESAERWNQYPEKEGVLEDGAGLGGTGRALRQDYAKGSQGKGGLKLIFGDSPVYPRAALRRGEKFGEIWWRVYVKHQPGWMGGGPDKLSRATSFASSSWSQAMIAHVWSAGESLTLDPATGVVGGEVVTQKYNDFERLRWLGNRPVSQLKIHSAEEAGRWVCVEARVKLNTPGMKDGINQLWLDGRLECERRNLDWRGSYEGHGINAVLLESYWNKGSPADQARWLDHFVVSTAPIGPLVTSRQPVLSRTGGPEEVWEVEVALAGNRPETVWRSNPLRGGQVKVDAESGTFCGPQAAAKALAADLVYVTRIRQVVAGHGWSPWHQAFRTGKGED
ncbi:MAG: hypothetical protein LDL31_09325 [Prosthecobacter sp.]|nr:hypothetical protein [Prosthecobacter sp.]